MSQVKRLGMGLGALLGGPEPEAPAEAPAAASGAPSSVELSLIRPNPYQPRSDFDPEDLQRLADSLKRHGLLQPVVLRPVPGGLYQLVAGERRWRASKLAGLERIPAVVRPVDDQKMLECALVENLQRRDLNPMEKARAFKQLMQLNNWTQESLADAVGLGRPTVANFMRLLEAPLEVQEAVSRGTLSMGHARALMGISQKAQMLQMLRRILEEDLSVREVEKLLTRRPTPASPPRSSLREPYLQELEQKLMDKVGVRVEIMPEAIVIPYGSSKQLSDILRRLGVIV
ncbi:MAG TPA: ParB/RepB/Spo0J family partition protein [Planctomycetota bacterium]|nr:ParB/RepB/Spo0J family partition protein [Planctomycetota bacterium]